MAFLKRKWVVVSIIVIYYLIALSLYCAGWLDIKPGLCGLLILLGNIVWCLPFLRYYLIEKEEEERKRMEKQKEKT
ncbi:hypothetical protein COS93_00965 [bacterium (Candidatus Gribaldobacteria) CG07_land_8_20_14_0_80_33_18]|uniref:DUF2842 domain-containing protein n=1 Tax=bacterium (Candidatus Gribaldobacteria) CG07_land_8_20_14_0_80_33_18 TaxID=2014272 RepID=A0A2M6Z3W5_9BACT|nr:MAG: hypothetical protein COU04_00490 [bacterium (Candidatus Gribaldobacteria) CG10_big_fil_rev_8_21_14_0_10_33_41]PIU47025.1 MAG: hypothetical protein COS93_00965 [bacterium (Candidatus Gribaldobacteria) CG07_land_8_20_14_0_80_33_18]PJA01246.1 MAG: hypothetical protein COX75_00330 [bacterium (Candidatus Gribaldobacteria) CG_4_10_14_0_2_um_filter_33_15]PJB08373.1 MAG: hypothetical protein CO122_01910 [bacterium (Candidatus Gribaldobacteria) CG_4_9_14_3_um_filter_33_9]